MFVAMPMANGETPLVGTAVRSAIATARQHGCGLYFTSTTFAYNHTLTFDGIDAYGDGIGSILQAANVAASAIYLTGNNPQLRHVRITSSQAMQRLSTRDSTGVVVDDTKNFVVDHVTVDKTASVGIFNYGGASGSITWNTVNDTLADGIHNTHGANTTEVAFNTVHNLFPNPNDWACRYYLQRFASLINRSGSHSLANSVT
ncbi:MAG: right-handed parallel beta-helix repeat-containing protein [Gammaproteobacteria bacterium]|nr:right-handed parallel beta-helix repeat-containing protein [Gammaproteobacteria bacterium]